jgi:prepilin-type N-terminal cleavage/methylation domain-containing protein
MSANCTSEVRRGSGAFTLIELMASMAILGLIMVMLFSVFDQVSKAWTNGENRVETFTQARAILDLMSRELSQAVATPKITFHGDVNAVYFVAPVNSDPANQADLCEVGYEYELTGLTGPPAWTFKIRRRLTEPTPGNIVSGLWKFYANPAGWWTPASTSFDPNREATLATNSILGLQFRYFDNSTPPIAYATPYNSQAHNDKLPYAIQISVDAVDSRTVAKLKLVGGPGTSAGQTIIKPVLRSFSTFVYLPNK